MGLWTAHLQTESCGLDGCNSGIGRSLRLKYMGNFSDYYAPDRPGGEWEAGDGFATACGKTPPGLNSREPWEILE